MIDLNHNRACELSEAKHDKNIIFNRACELDEVNHVRFHHTTKIKIIL